MNLSELFSKRVYIVYMNRAHKVIHSSSTYHYCNYVIRLDNDVLRWSTSTQAIPRYLREIHTWEELEPYYQLQIIEANLHD